MRALTIFVSLLVLLPACRRPPQEAAPAPVMEPPPPPPPEPEPEAPPPPPPPPEPPKPTSPPPVSEAGFTFGQKRKDAMNTCYTKGAWKKQGKHYACTKVVEDPGFPGKPVLGFCQDQLCAVGIVYTPEAPDFETWNQSFEKMREVLVGRHGEPTTAVEEIPEDCKNENFLSCVDEGKATKELSWKWDNHVVRLTLSKKLTGEGPSAIRFVSMPQAAEGGTADAGAAAADAGAAPAQ